MLDFALRKEVFFVDERRQNLLRVRAILERYIEIFLEAAKEPENRNSRFFFEACLEHYRDKVLRADSFATQADCIGTLHYLCFMCNLWLPKAREKIWFAFCTLNRFARGGMVEHFETNTLLALVESRDTT